jgi:RHS repeat-associated protein
LIRGNGIAPTYDANGDPTTNGLGIQYTFDARHRLVQISQGVAITASFQYDAFDRRVSKTDANGVTTAYLYDGSDAIQETSGTTTRTSLTGQNIDERFARDDVSGRTYFLTDAIGSTIALTDATANIQQRYDYEPYGEVKATGTTGLTNPYQYTGRENDGNGLYYYRARYYDPATKRFISEDPLQEAAGINSYGYVGGNPISLIDPTGLQSRDFNYEYRQSGARSPGPNVGYHYYNIFVPLCVGCSPSDAFNAMRNYSAPRAPYALNGTHDVLLFGNNPIRQIVNQCDKAITNETLPGHIFGGSVTISIIENNGVVGAQIVGTGTGPNAIGNQLGGPLLISQYIREQ